MTDSDFDNVFRDMYRVRSARLQGWDYASPGLYFVTICVKDRVPCLAEITDGEVHLSRAGEIAAEELQKVERLYVSMAGAVLRSCHPE
jgi:REP-associated tyrosine transposase